MKKILLVGAGTMGNHHARVISQSQDAELVALVDPRIETGNQVAEKFEAKWYPELPDLKGIDAVVVAAATEAHYELAMKVISQGKPLLIEKPVADSLLRTEEILAAADNINLPFMCGLLERFNPAILTAKSLFDSPFHIVATRHSPYAPRIKTGVAWDLLVHDVDLAVHLLGSEPVKVDSRLGYFHPDSLPGAEDVAETIMEFGSGALAQVSASRVGQRKIRQLSIYQQDRLVELDLLRRDVTVYHHISENSADGEGRGYKQQTVIEIPELVTSKEPLTSQFEHFIKIIDGTIDSQSERESILASHRVIEEVTSKRKSFG